MRGASSRAGEGSKRNTSEASATSRLRELREEKDFTQEELAERAGMHRNSIYNLEKGISREITAENATALASALRVRPHDLGLAIRTEGVPRSVGFRRLTPEQRQLIDELMSLSPREYEVIREALDRLRAKKRRRKS